MYSSMDFVEVMLYVACALAAAVLVLTVEAVVKDYRVSKKTHWYRPCVSSTSTPITTMVFTGKVFVPVTSMVEVCNAHGPAVCVIKHNQPCTADTKTVSQ